MLASAFAAGCLAMLIALLFPPAHPHYAGGDVGHYRNIAQHYRQSHASSRELLPPGVADAIETAVTEPISGARRMTRFIQVDDNRVAYPHTHGYPRLLAQFGNRAELVNYGLLAGPPAHQLRVYETDESGRTIELVAVSSGFVGTV